MAEKINIEDLTIEQCYLTLMSVLGNYTCTGQQHSGNMLALKKLVEWAENGRPEQPAPPGDSGETGDDGDASGSDSSA